MEIKSIKVTRTVWYGPEEYLNYCEEESEEPTQEGFAEFIDDWIYEDMCKADDIFELIDEV